MVYFNLHACAPRATEGILVPSAQGPAASIGRHPVERVGGPPDSNRGHLRRFPAVVNGRASAPPWAVSRPLDRVSLREKLSPAPMTL